VELRKFCHDKKLSFKHLVNLTFYPQDLLFQLIQWKTILPFTASIFEEVASHLNDYLKAEGKKISDFVSEPAVQQILSSEALPRQKLEQLRYLIYTKRFPTLNKVNKKIEKTVEELSLPKEITLSWDKTLENKGVEVKFQINEPLAWKVVLSKLSTTEFHTTLTKILDEL
jgi:hypothetical protein